MAVPLKSREYAYGAGNSVCYKALHHASKYRISAEYLGPSIRLTSLRLHSFLLKHRNSGTFGFECWWSSDKADLLRKAYCVTGQWRHPQVYKPQPWFISPPVFRYGLPSLQVGSETVKPPDNLKHFTGTQTSPHFSNIFFHHKSLGSDFYCLGFGVRVWGRLKPLNRPASAIRHGRLWTYSVAWL